VGERRAGGPANVFGIVEPLAGGPTNLVTLWSLVPEALPNVLVCLEPRAGGPASPLPEAPLLIC
jgi:hypothetical protein